MSTGTLDIGMDCLPYPLAIYISGPMRGYPEFNFPAFFDAEKYIDNQLTTGPDVTVINPARLDNQEEGEKPFSYYLRRDLLEILAHGVNAMFMLPGWQNSEGARLEHDVAKALDMQIRYLCPHPEWPGQLSRFCGWDSEPFEAKGPTKSWAKEADELVNGERRADYGHPSVDFARTAGLLSSYFGGRTFESLTAEDVPLIMMMLKLSREANKHKRDNMVDIIGYALTLQLVKEKT